MGDTAAEAATRRRLGATAVTGGAGACIGCADGIAAPSGPPLLGGNFSAAAFRSLAAVTAAAVGADEGSAYMLRWAAGVLMLSAVLVLQTLLSNYQNWAAAAYGKAPYEGIFYSHALSLPMFVLTARDLSTHAAAWSTSPAVGSVVATRIGRVLADPGVRGILARFAAAPLTAIGVTRIPVMWVYLLANVASQYACIVGVYTLTGLADPLTVNVALTVRKFGSLMLSIAVFNNTFTAPHWVGAVLVFLGAFLYSRQPPAAAPVKRSRRGSDPSDGSDANNATAPRALGSPRSGAGRGMEDGRELPSIPGMTAAGMLATAPPQTATPMRVRAPREKAA